MKFKKNPLFFKYINNKNMHIVRKIACGLKAPPCLCIRVGRLMQPGDIYFWSHVTTRKLRNLVILQ